MLAGCSYHNTAYYDVQMLTMRYAEVGYLDKVFSKPFVATKKHPSLSQKVVSNNAPSRSRNVSKCYRHIYVPLCHNIFRKGCRSFVKNIFICQYTYALCGRPISSFAFH